MSNTILHSFSQQTDGSNPYCSVIVHNEILYGTASNGSTENLGTLFSYDLSSETFTVLHSFIGPVTDGALSYASVIYQDGTLYGTTSYGGDNDKGTLFGYDLSSGIFTVLYSLNDMDGTNPNSALFYLDGKLYGTAIGGGLNNLGTFFSYELSTGDFTVLKLFTGEDGSNPFSSVIYQDGLFYGTTTNGGANNYGSLYSYELSSGILTTLYSFSGMDGESPYGSVVYQNGILYGTTTNGGMNYGVLFRFELSSGSFTVLHFFTGTETDGAYPFGSIIYQDGVLYGTTIESGAYSHGTLYSYDLNTETYTIFHSFTGTPTDASYPFSSLMYYNGVFYGASSGGGANDQGALFRFDFVPISGVCFPAGTPISCDQGNIPIDKINPLKHTVNNQTITAITRTISQDAYLVCFEQHALAHNCPSQTTVMSKNHKILYRGKMTEAYQFLRHSKQVRKVKYNREILYNVLMEKHDSIGVNNLVCETLHPNNIVARLHNSRLKQKEKNEIIRLMNESIHQKDRISYESVARRIHS